MLKFPQRTRSFTRRAGHIICITVWLGSIIHRLIGISYRTHELNFSYVAYTIHISFVSGLSTSVMLLKKIIIPSIIPTSIIIMTTMSTLYYLIESRKAAERSGGRLRRQGMVTVTVLPFTISHFITFRSDCSFRRTVRFLTAINIMSNFYIYSLTIPSFRQYVWSEASTSYRSMMSILHRSLSLPSTQPSGMECV